MEKIVTSLDQHGRMLIPAFIRDKLNIHPGDKVTLEIANNSLTVKNIDVIIDEMHAIFTKKQANAKQNIVEDFIKDKREDFKIEEKRGIKK